jgi:hypothetical protein
MRVRLIPSTGEPKELFPPLKIKDNAVHAGHFLPSEPWKVFMPSKTGKSKLFLNKL